MTKKIQEEVSAKKVPTKKSAVRKTVSSKKNQAPSLSPELCFWVCNGPVVDSLPHLKTALLHMTDEQFAFHTKRTGNDFARWARDVAGCAGCAGRLEKAKTRTSAAKAIEVCKACAVKE